MLAHENAANGIQMKERKKKKNSRSLSHFDFPVERFSNTYIYEHVLSLLVS